MKPFFSIVILFSHIFCFSQNNQRTKDSLALFAPTEIGKPDGEIVSAVIGNNGGRLMSSDKKVELVFPVGALAKETTISIQPSTNPSTEPIGKSYRFEPEGLTFSKPVQLLFHYTDSTTKDGSPKILSIATQNDKGVWMRLSKVKLDTLTKTISGETTHFSWFAMSWAIICRPKAKRVKVDKQVEIELYVTPCSYGDPAERPQVEIAVFDYQHANPRNWSVNGIPDGDAKVGTIIKAASREITNVFFKAPSKVPDENPVQITVEIKGVEDYRVDEYMNITKKCEIKVYDDQYEVTMIGTMKGGSKETWGGNSSYKDAGSFIVSLDKKEPEVIEIVNRFEVLTYDNCPDRIVTNPKSNTGLFHVQAATKIKVTPSDPPGNSTIEIWFVKYPIEMTQFTFNCPPPPGHKGRSKGKIDFNSPVAGAPSPLLMMFGFPAMPHYIKFIANDKEQTIVENGKPGGEIYYKISVKKVEKESW